MAPRSCIVGVAVLASLLVAQLSPAAGFYLPGVPPVAYKRSERLPLYVNKIESTCVGAHNDGRMCKFRPTAACVKTCGNFTIPGNATGRRNSGTSLPTNTVVTRLLGYETLVVTCDSNYRLNLAGSCHYEATLRCDADTGVDRS